MLGVVMAFALEAVTAEDERRVDLGAIVLLAAISAPLLARRRWPIPVVLAVLAVSTPYHLLDYPHEATMPALLVAAFTAARYSEPPRPAYAALVAVAAVILPVVAASGAPGDALLGVGWLFMAFFAGLTVRFYGNWKVAVGVLIDTLLVRSIVVPALTMSLGSRIWWPSKLWRATEDSVDDRV